MAYNGHKNWTHWNVSLWLSNDEGLYSLVQEGLRYRKTKDQAAEYIFDTLVLLGTFETPDGARYSRSNIRAALVGI